MVLTLSRSGFPRMCDQFTSEKLTEWAGRRMGMGLEVLASAELKQVLRLSCKEGTEKRDSLYPPRRG